MIPETLPYMGWLQEMQEMCRAFARADGITYRMPKHLYGFAKKVIHLCFFFGSGRC